MFWFSLLANEITKNFISSSGKEKSEFITGLAWVWPAKERKKPCQLQGYITSY